MPTPTTSTGSAGETPTLPKPTNKAKPYDQLRTFDEAMDYALGGYHVSLAQAGKASGARGRLWADAADAYRTAYLTMLPLKTLPADQGFAQAKDLLKKANHMADQASAAGGSS